MVGEAAAASALGKVLSELGRHSAAMTYHQKDLALSESDPEEGWRGKARALSNLGSTLEAMGDHHGAVGHHEAALGVAGANDDLEGKVRALSALGKIHHAALAQMDAAISFLQQAVAEIETTNPPLGKIRYFLTTFAVSSTTEFPNPKVYGRS